MCKNSWCEREHVYVVTGGGAVIAVRQLPELAREIARAAAGRLVGKFCV